MATVMATLLPFENPVYLSATFGHEYIQKICED